MTWSQISRILHTGEREADEENHGDYAYKQGQVWFTLGWEDEEELGYHDQAEQEDEQALSFVVFLEGDHGHSD